MTNSYFTQLPSAPFSPEIAKKKRLIASPLDLGICDAAKSPILPAVAAIEKAAKEMGTAATFQGYPPPYGYEFLRQAISNHEYEGKISPDEVFIGAGAKNELSAVLELLPSGSKVAAQDPSCPLYQSASLLSGMEFSPLCCLEENNFTPCIPSKKYALIYLSSPNNPTGKTLSKKELAIWVDYALQENCLLVFDSTCEGFIQSGAPHSIYEIANAKKVAIEIRSFSKKGGFANLRCSYTIVPKECKIASNSAIDLWRKRCCIRSGGVPYLIQKGALAIYSVEGQSAVKKLLQQYQLQTALLHQELSSLGFSIYGGIDAPYIWCKAPAKKTSWQFFDELLTKTNIVTIPGIEFGKHGEGFVRFSALADPTILKQAIHNLQEVYSCAT